MTGQNKQRQQQKEEKPDHTPHEVLQTLFAGVSPKQSVGHVCCFLLADPLLAFLISFLLFLFHPKWTQRFAFCPEAVPCCKEVCDRARVEGTPSQLIYCSSHCSIPCSARECQQSLEGLPPLSLWGWSFSHHSTPPPTHTHPDTHLCPLPLRYMWFPLKSSEHWGPNLVSFFRCCFSFVIPGHVICLVCWCVCLFL